MTNVTVASTFPDDVVLSGTISASVAAAKSLIVRDALAVSIGSAVMVGEALIVEGQLTTNGAIAARDVVLNFERSVFVLPIVTSAPAGNQIVFLSLPLSGT